MQDRNILLLLKTTLFAVLIPGTVAGYIPYRIISRYCPSEGISFSIAMLLPMLLFSAGLLVAMRCAMDFVVHGHGTPAPIDPPKQLVVQGLYRYTRNPMYLGILMILLGEAWGFWCGAQLLYAIVLWICFHLFVVFYEEPNLLQRFGEAYRLYRAAVPRWWVKWRPYSPADQPN
jgi:protein-S-isoprenylcysteine O-methyltransferase Ste14